MHLPLGPLTPGDPSTPGRPAEPGKPCRNTTSTTVSYLQLEY